MVIHELHKKYGPVVRIGPNVLDLDFPELIKTIYNTKGNYRKVSVSHFSQQFQVLTDTDPEQTEFYHGSSVKANGKIIYNLFSECDPQIHAQQKRPISKHYSMTGVLPLEPHLNDMIEYLCQRLEETFVNGSNSTKVCDLSDWIVFCMSHL